MSTDFLTFASVGAIIGAIITMISTHTLKTRELRVKLLEDKLNKLYGPIYYYIKLNRNFFEQNSLIHSSWITEYVVPSYSQEPLTQERLNKSDQDTMYIKQKYQEQILANNEQIKQALDNNFSLIDIDDIDIFLQFYHHRTRLLVEVKNEQNIRIPNKIYKHLEDISLMPKEFSDRVEDKFKQKKEKLDRLNIKKWWLFYI
jgi:hypothetical protein